ncbi:hypothetical protein TWF481_000366 [Arthrobotrys musiformis]|uniref:Uncharacterized protein n=1 Tax=Arthrobotrys musiformis TaxID=47236 RepID=A0AAV9WNZ6_9PEZI
MFSQRILNLFRRGLGEKKEKKREGKKQEGEYIYGNRMMVVAPITLGLALPEMSPTAISSEVPSLPQPAILRDQISPAARVSCHSVFTYGQEDLADIDQIPRPAFPRSLSAEMLREERSQLDRHLRYETLNKKGLCLPTVVVGPKRLAALGEWEDLEERAGGETKGALFVPPKMSDGSGEAGVGARREFGDCKITVPTKPVLVSDSEPSPLVGRTTKGLRLRRWVGSKVDSIVRPNPGPIETGFRFRLRDGVDQTVDTSSLRLYGRDKPGLKRTVHPRPWSTVLVTSATRPRAVPREYYREFARAAWYYYPQGFKSNDEEYAAFEQWVESQQ